MECTVHWVAASGMGFMAETGSGHLLAMDGAPDGGGRNLAPRPLETVLAGTGGCSAYDVVLILRRGRHDISGCSVKITAERAPVDPKVFTRIHMHFTVTGRNLPDAASTHRDSHQEFAVLVDAELRLGGIQHLQCLIFARHVVHSPPLERELHKPISETARGCLRSHLLVEP